MVVTNGVLMMAEIRQLSPVFDHIPEGGILPLRQDLLRDLGYYGLIERRREGYTELPAHLDGERTGQGIAQAVAGEEVK